jgi:hypothetical protein
MRKATLAHPAQAAPQLEQFLRSINLRFDADHPERVEHFRPTTKCVALLRSLAGLSAERALLIVAPYGSGKSLSATYLLHLLENRPPARRVLAIIADRLHAVSGELAAFATDRLADEAAHGLILALHGHCESLGESLRSAAVEAFRRHGLGRHARALEKTPCESGDDALSLLRAVHTKAADLGMDRVAVLWDEFGRHLESLIQDGRSSALGEVQSLAEYATRSAEPPVTLGVLLHQDLLQYAAHLPQSVRAEWKKIEGRFYTTQYVDDSKELYRLLGELISERASAGTPSPEAVSARARRARELGLFPDFGQRELEELLAAAYPLEPAALYLLPRLSARVAQNERTLFTFLHASELHDLTGPDRLFDYFAPAMRADTAAGGTYRQWLETQSALSNAGDDDDAARTLKIACLLGLGTSGERTRTSRDLLLYALDGYRGDNGAAATVDRLVERKLLLHRRHGDEVAVWHGADRDLRGRLEDEKNRERAAFDLVAFLSVEAPPQAWRPVEYNDDFHVRRFLQGECCDLATLTKLTEAAHQQALIPVGCDGKILYVVVESREECEQAGDLAQRRVLHPRLVTAVPKEPVPVREVAMEVASLLRMQVDGELVGSDPMVRPELLQMTDDARAELQRLADRLTRPGRFGPRWFSRGTVLPATTPRKLRACLSELMPQVFRLTPRINNEMIVRHAVSPQVVNARKKLLMAILERSGEEGLGIEGNFPDASMFRTVLVHTGLYRRNPDGRWTYALPEEIGDPGLREVWSAFRQFFCSPAPTPKEPEHLLQDLQEPPYGLRAGVLPVLVSAALRAFPSAVSLTKDGTYVPDLLPSVVEDLCREPAQYRLRVLDLDDDACAYLRGLCAWFGGEETGATGDSDLIRRCYDALESWKARLSEAALTSRRVSDPTQRFQAAIQQRLEPAELLLRLIPQACGHEPRDTEELLAAVLQCRDEMEGVTTVFESLARDSLARALGARVGDPEGSLRQTAKRWADCFSVALSERLPDAVTKGLLARMRMPYGSDARFLDSLASLLVGKRLHRWDDGSVVTFDREMHDVVHRIEEAALATPQADLPDMEAARGLAQLARARMEELFDRLVQFVGREEAEGAVELMVSSNKEE